MIKTEEVPVTFETLKRRIQAYIQRFEEEPNLNADTRYVLEQLLKPEKRYYPHRISDWFKEAFPEKKVSRQRQHQLYKKHFSHNE